MTPETKKIHLDVGDTWIDEVNEITVTRMPGDRLRFSVEQPSGLNGRTTTSTVEGTYVIGQEQQDDAGQRVINETVFQAA